jgi:hypothetical protein
MSGNALRVTLEKDFGAFLRERARLMAGAIAKLADGEKPTLESVV